MFKVGLFLNEFMYCWVVEAIDIYSLLVSPVRCRERNMRKRDRTLTVRSILYFFLKNKTVKNVIPYSLSLFM